MLKTVYKTKDDGTAYLEIEDNLNMAIAGFTAKDTAFNDDGTIRPVKQTRRERQPFWKGK